MSRVAIVMVVGVLLAADGFLEGAHNLQVKVERPPLTMPSYTLTVRTEDVALREDLSWGMPMLRRLGGLRKVLEGEAAKEMDLLLGRLSGLRAQWEKEAGGDWTMLYAHEEWYKEHGQPERIAGVPKVAADHGLPER